MRTYFGNNLSGINSEDSNLGAGQVSISVPSGTFKTITTTPKATPTMTTAVPKVQTKTQIEELKDTLENKIQQLLSTITAQRNKAIQAAKVAIAKERKADIEATVATYQTELNKKYLELKNALNTGFEEARLERIKIISEREAKLKLLQNNILKERTEALESAASAAKTAREKLIKDFNLKLEALKDSLNNTIIANQAKNEAAMVKQKTDILAIREAALKTAIAEAKMARDIILKDMQSNIKTQLDLVRAERKEVIDSIKKEFNDAILAAQTAREEIEAKRMSDMQNAKAEILASREKAISDLYTVVKKERENTKQETLTYVNKTVEELKTLSKNLTDQVKAEAASGIAALKSEREKALEEARIKLVNEREKALKLAAVERSKLEENINILEAERTARIKADEKLKAQKKEEIKKAIHPMALIQQFWSKKIATQEA